MHLPNKEQAHVYLKEAALLNPGGWIAHSEYAAQAAYAIATHIPELDPDAAYILGLLHDIGRRVGIIDLSHAYTGYQFMMKEGFSDMARICISHSFVVKDTRSGKMNWDGGEKSLAAVQDYLDTIEYNLYDRLIQLCDAVSVSTGYWLIEKRLLDVGLRRGVSPTSPETWKQILAIKEAFDTQLGFSVYQLLPGIVENTFGFNPNGSEG